MKRWFLSLLVLFVGAVGWGYDWSANPGDGSADNPFQLSEPNHLIALGVDAAISEGGFHFILTNDIVFAPESNADHFFEDTLIESFDGILDGRGHFIGNLTIISEAEKMSHIGLFGTLEENGVIRNLEFSNAVIRMPGLATPSDNIGVICGRNKGLIEQCKVMGLVRGTIIIGGIAGANWGSIYDCYMAGIIDAFGSVGGICGYNGGPNDRIGVVRRCYSRTQINTTGFTNGALVGQYFNGELAECAWDSDISEVTTAYSLNSGSEGEGIENIYRYNTAQMKEKSRFSFLDFEGDPNNGTIPVWRMCVDGVTSPRLNWEFYAQGDFVCDDGVGLEDFGLLSHCYRSVMNLDVELDDDGDRVVSLNELARLSLYWLQTECGCNGADTNGDGAVNATDLGAVVDSWLLAEYPECRIVDTNKDAVIDLVDLTAFMDTWLDER